MSELVDFINIEYFKSIRKASLYDCSRINLFIGKPNVGKSNFLEAMSMLSLPYLKLSNIKKITSLVRIENLAELFFDGNNNQKIKIETDFISSQISFIPIAELIGNVTYISENKLKIIFKTKNDVFNFQIDENLVVKSEKSNKFYPIIKKYIFQPKTNNKKSNISFLLPPYGNNLMDVIGLNKNLKSQLENIFAENGLKLVFDKASQTIKIIKVSKENDLFLLPYSSIADTLQRIIFYKTAIASNHNSVLLLEEPEAHSFPPYIVHITQEIINSTSNQYFISTHSPYIVNDFLENARDELSIFLFDFVNGETIIKRLSNDEIFEIYQHGVDLFINSESYLP